MSAVLETAPHRFRAMTPADLKAIMGIESKVYPYPWSEGIMRDCIRVGYFCQVLEESGRIDAYGIMSMAAGEAHVLNLCVHPRAQGRGLARSMLECLLDTASTRSVRTVFLEVRSSNEKAMRLYEAAGFCAVGWRKNYYPDGGRREDALVMAKELMV